MITAEQFARCAADPATFRAELIVDVDGAARRFGDVMDPWQRDDFAALDPALQRCNGRKPAEAEAEGEPVKMRAYLERGRGHSKTTDLAVTGCWALAFANRPLKGFAFAADQDQADLLRQAMETLIRLNPWLGAILEVQRDAVINKAEGHPGDGSRLEIWTSDVASSYGILPDLIIADELCHWQGDGSLWHSIISSAAKRSNCLLVVISNAGFADSWQWTVREAARTDPAWIFSRLDGPQASWLTEARLAEQRRMLPPVAYLRLWENQWSSGGGDALTPADIAAAFSHCLGPMDRSQVIDIRTVTKQWLFVAGLDLGLTRDSSAVVVLAVPAGGGSGQIRLAQHRRWAPVPGKKVDLMEVERAILEFDREFGGLENVAFDPWQAELMAQRLEADSGRRRRNQQRRFNSQPWMREVPPTAANLRAQATLIIESFQDRRLTLYPCEPLRCDLLKLRVEERSYGIRLTSPRDGDGHGDLFSAFSLALLVAHEFAGKKPVVAGAVGAGDGRTPFERAWDRFERRAEAEERERERLAAGHAFHNEEGYIEIMKAAGGRSRLRRLR